MSTEHQKATDTHKRTPEEQAEFDALEAKHRAAHAAHQVYPKMLYRKKLHPTSGEPYNDEQVAKDEDEEKRMAADGWGEKPAEAFTKHEANERAVNLSAVERTHTAANLRAVPVAVKADDEPKTKKG